MDPYGNVATGYTGTIGFSSSDSAASLPVTYNGSIPAAPVPATYTFAPEQQGAGTFYVTFGTSGTQSLTATDSKTSTITGTASGLAVQAGTGALAIQTRPPPRSPTRWAASASGQTVTLTATVKATASGVANPTDGVGHLLSGFDLTGTVNLSGSDLATFTTGPLSVGTYQFFAVYNGDAATYMPSASSCLHPGRKPLRDQSCPVVLEPHVELRPAGDVHGDVTVVGSARRHSASARRDRHLL